jgi:hypothetical protein
MFSNFLFAGMKSANLMPFRLAGIAAIAMPIAMYAAQQ